MYRIFVKKINIYDFYCNYFLFVYKQKENNYKKNERKVWINYQWNSYLSAA